MQSGIRSKIRGGSKMSATEEKVFVPTELNDCEVKALEKWLRWLKTTGISICPSVYCSLWNCSICIAIFPIDEPSKIPCQRYQCPCYRYPVELVAGYVEQTIKYNTK